MFFEYQESTIGGAFVTRTIPIGNSDQMVKFDIWDTYVFHLFITTTTNNQ